MRVAAAQLPAVQAQHEALTGKESKEGGGGGGGETGERGWQSAGHSDSLQAIPGTLHHAGLARAMAPRGHGLAMRVQCPRHAGAGRCHSRADPGSTPGPLVTWPNKRCSWRLRRRILGRRRSVGTHSTDSWGRGGGEGEGGGGGGGGGGGVMTWNGRQAGRQAGGRAGGWAGEMRSCSHLPAALAACLQRPFVLLCYARHRLARPALQYAHHFCCGLQRPRCCC